MPVRIQRPGGELKGQLRGASAAVLYGAQTNYTALYVALLLHFDPFSAMRCQRRQAVHFTSTQAECKSRLGVVIFDFWAASAESGSCLEPTSTASFLRARSSSSSCCIILNQLVKAVHRASVSMVVESDHHWQDMPLSFDQNHHMQLRLDSETLTRV